MTVESTDLRDLLSFARQFDLQGAQPLLQLAELASSVMPGVGPAALLRRVDSLRDRRAPTPLTPTKAEAVAFVAEPTMDARCVSSMRSGNQPGSRVYRPDVLHGCRSAMQAAVDSEIDLLSAAVQARGVTDAADVRLRDAPWEALVCSKGWRQTSPLSFIPS